MSDLPLVLDLFSGTGSATQPFVECGKHRVVRIDIAGEPDVRADVRRLPIKPGVRPQFVWASPPCTAFSYARHIWAPWPDPKVAPQAIALLRETVRTIRRMDPEWWLLENPRGHAQDILGKPLFETPYCAWGMDYKKPTQFWGRFPHSLRQPCRHSRHRVRITFRQTPLTPAQRHKVLRSRSGTGRTVFEVTTRDPLERARIPHPLAKAVHRAICPEAEP